METWVALLRGINVGRAKRVAMADLRAVLVDLGYADPRTVLQSGNAVFEAPGKQPKGAAERIREAVAARTGVTADVLLLTGKELAGVAADNPLLDVATDPSRLVVWFLSEPLRPQAMAALEKGSWAPEAYAVTGRAAYLWCPDGQLSSPLATAFGGLAFGGPVTARNWNTVQKILAKVQPQQQGRAR